MIFLHGEKSIRLLLRCDFLVHPLLILAFDFDQQSPITHEFYDKDEDRRNLGILDASASLIDQCGMQSRFIGYALDRSLSNQYRVRTRR